MRKKGTRKNSIITMLIMTGALMLVGCGQNNNRTQSDSMKTGVGTATLESPISTENSEEDNEEDNGEDSLADTNTNVEDTNTDDAVGADELLVTFGDSGNSFTMHLYENNTAQAVAGHVGTANWRLPIYNYDNYEGWEYFQYYDIPSRYEIPSNPEIITSAKAGEVYYSEPNRIILFYQDAEISEEYTPIGYIDSSEEFVEAVEENPVLEGWGNKIVLISDGE